MWNGNNSANYRGNKAHLAILCNVSLYYIVQLSFICYYFALVWVFVQILTHIFPRSDYIFCHFLFFLPTEYQSVITLLWMRLNICAADTTGLQINSPFRLQPCTVQHKKNSKPGGPKSPLCTPVNWTYCLQWGFYTTEHFRDWNCTFSHYVRIIAAFCPAALLIFIGIAPLCLAQNECLFICQKPRKWRLKVVMDPGLFPDVFSITSQEWQASLIFSCLCQH